ncbi:hypothetical protein KKF47_03045, partial [Patescibacteria group bacterium]|nr:hypothetical protein [Patescibacteria group bacterium]
MVKNQNQKKKNHQKQFANWRKDEKAKPPLLTSRTKRWIKATLMFLVAVIVALSFWDRAGKGGQLFLTSARFLIGQTVFTVPFLFLLGGLLFLKPKQKGKFLPIFLGIFVLVFGLAGILGAQNLGQKEGGWLGYLMAKLVVSAFGLLVANIIFGAVIIIGLLIFLQSLWQHRPQEGKEAEKKSLFQRIINPTRPLSIKIKEAEGKSEINHEAQPKISLFKNEKHETIKENGKKPSKGKEQYIFPSIDLLSKNEGSPTSGNIKQSSIIIKKTLENFGIPVEMAEANVGPTVT